MQIRDGFIAINEGELTCHINFTHDTFFENQCEKSYVRGFDCRCKIVFELQNAKINNIKKYADMKSNIPIAYITEVSVGREKFHLVENGNTMEDFLKTE
jgi:hypothetical protein